MASKLPSTLTFCEDYVRVAGDVANFSYWFVGAALLVGVLYGFVELLKKYRETGPVVRIQQSALKDLIDALKGLIEAIASAPAWIALFALGLVLFWAAASSIPEKCADEMNQPFATAKTDAAAPTKPPRPSPPDSNASRDGDGTPARDGSGLEK